MRGPAENNFSKLTKILSNLIPLYLPALLTTKQWGKTTKKKKIHPELSSNPQENRPTSVAKRQQNQQSVKKVRETASLTLCSTERVTLGFFGEFGLMTLCLFGVLPDFHKKCVTLSPHSRMCVVWNYFKVGLESSDPAESDGGPSSQIRHFCAEVVTW